MNFYPHHIGDYMTATAHLSWLEDCAYRRLLDIYYSREQAIPADIGQACRLVRAASKDERKAVETVLREFFVLAEGWTHKRCDEEISKAQVAADRARENGRKGGRPKKEEPTANPDKTQSVSAGNPEQTQVKAPNPNPITNPISSVPNGTDAKASLTPEEVIWTYGVPLLVNAGSTEKHARSFLGGLRKGRDDSEVVDALRACIRTKALQPLEYLAAALLPTATKTKPNAQEALEASNNAVVERFLNGGADALR